MTEQINEKIADFDKDMFKGSRIPPELTFDPSKKYDYKSPADSGTGASDKNLILFDLAILSLTPIPALIHDSPLLKNIADDTIENILKLYKKFTDRQIFIAFDKESSYSGEVEDTITNTQLIHLGEDEHALYGWAWYKDSELTKQRLENYEKPVKPKPTKENATDLFSDDESGDE